MGHKESFEVIASTIQNSWDINRVTFSSEDEEFLCSFGLNMYQFVPAVLSFMLPSSFKKKNQDSIKFLYDSFGEWRVKEVSDRWGLDISYKHTHGLSLSARDVKLIFAGMGDVRLNDIRRIYWDIREGHCGYLHMSKQQEKELHTHFREHDFGDLRKTDFDILYDLAIPFDDVNVLFCHCIPEFTKRGEPDFGDGALQQMKKRVFLVEEMRSSSDHTELAEVIRRVKKVYNYYMPEGTVIPHPEGYTYVFRMINQHGCYKFFHKSMNTLDCPSVISHLGTQVTNSTVPRGWETGLIDLHPNLGAAGAIATYDETNDLLTRPELGFVETVDEKVDLTGMSLGGALAFFDMCLFLNRVRKVSTVGNPGLDLYTLQLLAEKVRGLEQKIKVNMIFDYDDLVRLMGDGHAGLFCDPDKIDLEVTYVFPLRPGQKAPTSVPDNPMRPASPFETISLIYQSLFGPHLRETTASEFRGQTPLERHYSVITLSNQVAEQHYELSRLLDNRQKGWDKFRRKFFGWLGRPDLFYKFWLTHSACS